MVTCWISPESMLSSWSYLEECKRQMCCFLGDQGFYRGNRGTEQTCQICIAQLFWLQRKATLMRNSTMQQCLNRPTHSYLCLPSPFYPNSFHERLHFSAKITKIELFSANPFSVIGGLVALPSPFYPNSFHEKFHFFSKNHQNWAIFGQKPIQILGAWWPCLPRSL